MDNKENRQESSQPSEKADSEADARRRFLKTVGKGAVSAPAVALLLSNAAKAGGSCGSGGS